MAYAEADEGAGAHKRSAYREAELSFRLRPGTRKSTVASELEDAASWEKRVFDLRDLARNEPGLAARIRVEAEHVDRSAWTVVRSEAEAGEDSRAATLYSIEGADGLYVLSNALSHADQRYWVRRMMLDYVVQSPTNISNLTGNDELWDSLDETQLSKLRWIALGYHFQWTSRTYREELRGPFPPDLAALAQHMARVIGHSIEPEAAIINFYPPKSVMGGHLDDAEEAMRVPIVSLSLGCTAVFLLGGESKDVAPIAVLLRSGDVMLMAGAARRCYHGVPRIIQGTCPAHLTEEGTEHVLEDQYPMLCRRYMTTARLNANIRQVYLHG